MPTTVHPTPNLAATGRLPRLWVAVYAIIIVYVAVLAVETVLRIRFPWDLYFWSESAFLTNMMKLDQHQPIYTAAADGNSFVYSPGLEYICYGVLKPFGLELDIRWDRLVSTLLGVFAAGFGALAAARLARPLVAIARTKLFFFVTWGLVWLVLSKNFMADIDHPDNLQMLHATLIFWLCLVAVETEVFGAALLTMLVAGVGVLTKQTEIFCFLGPLVVFAIYRPWGWGRWMVLGAVGAGACAVSLLLLWHSADARFWTLELLTEHQRMSPSKAYFMAIDLLTMERGVLLYLGAVASACLWSAGSAVRRYLVCWASVGVFAALPNAAGYLKTMGIWNNLMIFEVWLIMIVWPFFIWLTVTLPGLRAGVDEGATLAWDRRAMPMAVCALMILFLLVLLPIKMPPRPSDYALGRKLDEAVQADVVAGRKVLLAHTAESLIHAGVREPPRDRANSALELIAGGLGARLAVKSRIEAHYYDRIYLMMGLWYRDDILACIDRNYQVDYVIPKSPHEAKLITGYGDLMNNDIPVLSPRTNTPSPGAH